MMRDDTTTWRPFGLGNFDWYDSRNWTGGVPTAEKIAVVDAHLTEAKEVAVKGLHVIGTGRASLDGLSAEEIVIAEQGYLATPKITVSREFTLAGGTVAGRQTNPQATEFDIPPGATLRITGPGDKSVNGYLHLRGNGVWSSSGRLLLSNEGLDVAGVLEIEEDATLYLLGALRVEASGRVRIAAGHKLVLDGTSLSQAGTVELLNGSTLSLRDGEHVLEAGARINGSGTVELAPGKCHSAAGTGIGCSLSGPGPVTLEPDVTLKIRPSEPTQDVIVRGPIEFFGGSIDWEGGNLYFEVLLSEPSALIVSGEAPHTLNGSLRLAGDGRIDCPEPISVSNGGIFNDGRLVVTSPATLTGWSALHNSGRLEISAPLNATHVALRNEGTIDVRTKELLAVSAEELECSSCATLQITISDEIEAATPKVWTTNCQLDGALEPELGYTPPINQPVKVLRYTSRQGKFASISGKPGVYYWRADYGDTELTIRPVRSYVGRMLVDYSAGVPTAEQIQDAGYEGAIRYVSDSPTGMPGKPIRKAEADSLRARDMVIVSTYQRGSTDWNDNWDWAQHIETGIAFHQAAGGPDVAPIYVCVDANPTEDQWSREIRPYLRAWQRRLGRERMGVYANYPTIDWAIRDGVGCYFWMHDWGSGGRVHPAAQLHQLSAAVEPKVGGVGVDRNVILKEVFGQWDPL